MHAATKLISFRQYSSKPMGEPLLPVESEVPNF